MCSMNSTMQIPIANFWHVILICKRLWCLGSLVTPAICFSMVVQDEAGGLNYQTPVMNRISCLQKAKEGIVRKSIKLSSE